MPSWACANAQTPSGDNDRVSWALEVRSSQNIGWPIRIEELHNCMNDIGSRQRSRLFNAIYSIEVTLLGYSRRLLSSCFFRSHLVNRDLMFHQK